MTQLHIHAAEFEMGFLLIIGFVVGFECALPHLHPHMYGSLRTMHTTGVTPSNWTQDAAHTPHCIMGANECAHDVMEPVLICTRC
jgi:hypothetical protein